MVRGNRIESVGPSGRIRVPAGATRVDVRGRTIIPGLIDVHAHVNGEDDGLLAEQSWPLVANLAYGVTTAHDPRELVGHGGVARVVVGHVLEVSSQGVETQPPRRAHVAEADPATPFEDSTLRRHRHELAEVDHGAHPTTGVTPPVAEIC